VVDYYRRAEQHDDDDDKRCFIEAMRSQEETLDKKAL
jgi:hypothetical protein